MPLDVLGRTRATMDVSTRISNTFSERSGESLKRVLSWDWGLQLFPMNPEFPVDASHHLALIKSLPFVHTARRYYRWDDSVRSLDWRLRRNTLRLTERRPNSIV